MPRPANVPFDPVLDVLIRRVLSVAETSKPEWDPAKVYKFNDGPGGGPQWTLSIGFTELGGNLKKVLEAYIKGGGALAAAFQPYWSTLGKKHIAEVKFKSLLEKAGTESVMRRAQETQFEELYLWPAYQWAIANGFALPLSYLVIADSFLHSGSMLAFLMNRFQEKRPVNATNEQRWIRSYLDTRKNWLASHSNKILHKTVYRANTYLEQLAKNNWDLNLKPIVMNGIAVFAA